MPRFTISRGGQVLQTLDLDDECIVMGSDRACPIFIDDLLISLKQAAFLKTPTGYQVVPKTRVPSLRLNGRVADQSLPLASGDIIEVEGYQICVDFQAPVEDTDSGRTEFHVSLPLGRLVIVAGPLKGSVRPLVQGEIRIGRDQSRNDIIIRTDSKGDIDKSISRRHASIHFDGTTVFVEDQQSVAGTFVNGRQIPPKQRITLKSGDQVEIRSAKESTILRVELDTPDSMSPSPSLLPDFPAAPPPSAAPLPPLSELPLPPPLPIAPLPATPPPLTPPPRRAPAPAWEPPPPEPIREPVDEVVRRPSRARARAMDNDNPFLPAEEVSWFKVLPQWVWFTGGAVFIILVVSLLLICR